MIGYCILYIRKWKKKYIPKILSNIYTNASKKHNCAIASSSPCSLYGLFLMEVLDQKCAKPSSLKSIKGNQRELTTFKLGRKS